ncbi:MAG TPA: universal stress protein [Allocoleopsis sp.]
MVKRILVAIDQSEISKTVFHEALTLAKATGATLQLLHVLSTEEEGSPISPALLHYPSIDHRVLEEYQTKWKTFEAHGAELLQSWIDEAAQVGVQAEFIQKYGNPGRTITEAARDWGADLIVIGRRGRSGLTELFLGSVSNYVVHHASNAVLVVQGQLPVSAATA